MFCRSCNVNCWLERSVLTLLALIVACSPTNLVAQLRPSANHVARSTKNMVASVHPLATDAGIEAFRSGGNAIDAAVAAALTLGVCDNYNSGIGGGCFILIRTSDGKVYALDGREMAPAAAHRDMYIRDGKADNSLSQVGPLASGTPGALMAFHEAVTRHGKLPFAQHLKAGQAAGLDGFIVTTAYAKRLASVVDKIKLFPATKNILLHKNGKPYQAGERLVQTDLGKSYQHIAEQGIDWFYRGDFAQQLEKWMQENGGILTAKDLANYRVVDRKPLKTTYRGYTIVGFPPPSSGGVHVAQILNILENFDLAALHESNPDIMRHVIAEAMKLAFADRAHWLGDPAFAKVPRSLIDKKYAKSLAARINLKRVTPVLSHGRPPRADTEFFGKHTTHVTAADAAGNWVAITSTLNTTFGSKVIIPGTGIPLNNQMDDFAIAPGVPNAYGLIGAEANSVQAGKRPLSSMSPTIILKDGQPIMTVGAAGGPKIITQVLLAIVRRLDLKLSLGESLRRPRWHHQWSPDRILIEQGNTQSTIDFLKARGHKVTVSSVAGVSQGIIFDPNSQTFVGAHDPRVPGKAGGQ